MNERLSMSPLLAVPSSPNMFLIFAWEINLVRFHCDNLIVEQLTSSGEKTGCCFIVYIF